MKRLALVILSALILMTGCKKIETFDNLIACWTNPAYADNTEGKTIVYYKKSKKLSTASDGVKFLRDGTLIERKNAGWCGTPPINYKDYSGKWQIQNGDEVKIDVAYWGGMEQKIWKIIEVSGSTLKIEIITWNAQY
jgi:hypothetical protein